jgi:putative flippase GtrA
MESSLPFGKRKQALKRDRFALFERILRYGVTGGLVSAVFSLLVMILVKVAPAIGPVGSSAAAFCLVQPIGYIAHRMITYADLRIEGAQMRRSWLRFLLTNMLGLAMTMGAMALVTRSFHASYLWGIALIWVTIPAMNFIIYLTWVFTTPPRPERVLR